MDVKSKELVNLINVVYGQLDNTLNQKDILKYI